MPLLTSHECPGYVCSDLTWLSPMVFLTVSFFVCALQVGAAVTTGVSQAGHWVSDKIKGKDGGEGGGPSHTV